MLTRRYRRKREKKERINFLNNQEPCEAFGPVGVRNMMKMSHVPHWASNARSDFDNGPR